MRKELVLSLVSLFALCACDKGNNKNNTPKSYDFSIMQEATYDVAGAATVTQRQLKKAEKWNPMISIGNPKMLVIPVDFEDYSCKVLDNGCDGTRSDIQKAYFGKSEDTIVAGGDADGWESVSSFYYKSSFEKLNITGTVTPWFTYNKTVGEISAMSTNAAQMILLEAVDWYKEYCKENNLPFDFDADQDGYIDCVQLIYVVPENYANSSTWWAYTSSLRGSLPDYDMANPYQFVFASQSFMYHDKHYVDAHTYIHETGHVLGLDDYYNTNKTGVLSIARPAGGIDMMDHNIGDHCAYSKFALEWVSPKIVTGEGQITLHPTTTTGDAIIVSPQWNQTAFDEYLMIEFHRPIGLNQKDASRKYAGSYPLVMNQNGIKVYHIDSRMAFVDAMSYEVVEFTTSFKQDAFHTTIMAHSNTPSNAGEDDYRLVHLLESSGKDTFITRGNTASNETLFKAGDTFGVKKDVFGDFKFHSGADLPFVFEITSISDEEAVITFLKK